MDDDDKIRRNLMVMSAAIIGAAWFDVPLTDLLERLFSVKGEGKAVAIAGWKLWIAALAVLAYLAWRYRWSDEVRVALEDLTASTDKRYAVLYKRDYLSTVERWILSGRLPADAHQQMQVALNYVVPSNLGNQMGRPIRVKISMNTEPKRSSGNEQVYVEASWGSPPKSHNGTTQVGLYIDTRRQEALVRAAQVHAFINSKASMSLLWPILIGGTAALIVLYKLFLSFNS